MSSKVYILNTKMTSSVYIKTLPFSYISKNCILVEFLSNLDTISFNKNYDIFLICGRETPKDDVLSYIEKKFQIKKGDIIVIDILHLEDYYDIMEKYGFKTDKLPLLHRKFPDDDYLNVPLSYNNDYYTDLCYEFFYNFVKPFYPELPRPKVEILEEMNGFMHIKNSIYKTVSDKFFEYKFYSKPFIVGNKYKKNFISGFGGRNMVEPIFLQRRVVTERNYDLKYSVSFNSIDRYINFLIKSMYGFGFYYEDKNNICYVIKRASKDLNEDCSYKINNRQYSFLSGINVPNWLYNTPADKLDINRILEIKNVDVRTVAIKKFGMTNLVRYGKVIDSWENYPDNEWWAKSEYQLIDMHDFVPPIKSVLANTKRIIRITERRYAPFLCMKNQTTGDYHLEGVSPECRNLYDALKMRYQLLDLPSYKIEDIK